MKITVHDETLAAPKRYYRQNFVSRCGLGSIAIGYIAIVISILRTTIIELIPPTAELTIK